MFAACDIGNSQIKLGLFDKNDLTEFRSFVRPDELFDFIRNIKIENFAVSSVVPEKMNDITKKLQSYKLHPFIITKESRFNLTINYDSIDTLGIDRICGCEGAYYLLKKSPDFKNFTPESSIIVIDFGTATTLNIIIYPSEFIGGIIAPGIKMMFDSLHKNTSQLPEVRLNDYKSLAGRDTKSAIASGVINSTTGLIEKTISYLKLNMNSEKIRIYITGGNAGNFPEHFDFDFEYEKGLVLYGIKAIFEINN